MKKIKILYVLGPAYSGSTLFGLFLGKHPDILNLGEVINLENDYHENGKCSCDESLKDCMFWQKNVSSGVFKKGRKRRGIDERGGLVKLPMVVFGVESVFAKKERDTYLKWNESFFQEISERYSGYKYIVDLSKSPERLSILLKSKILDVRCIYLGRSLESVYASTLKRPKKTRSKYGFKIVRESFWLYLRNRYSLKAFNGLEEKNRFHVDWDEFTHSPYKLSTEICSWLEVPQYSGNIRKINVENQHIYVGNRWLVGKGLKEVLINKKDKRDTLSRMEKFSYKLFNR